MAGSTFRTYGALQLFSAPAAVEVLTYVSGPNFEQTMDSVDFNSFLIDS